MTHDKSSCSHTELITRVVALEASTAAFKDLMNERDKRYSDALGIAASSVEKRLEGLNELRAMTEDQARTYARDAEVKLTYGALEKRIDDLARVVSDHMARGRGLNQAWAYAIAGFGLLAMIVGALVPLWRH